MSTLMVTLLLTFVFMSVALALLGISWLITGKSRIRLGMCGRVPTQEQDPKKGCGTQTTCSICQPDDEK